MRAYLSVATGESGQPHAGHVKEPDLAVVVGQSNHPLVHRHTDPDEHMNQDRKRI